MLNWLKNPLVIAAVVATAIAIPIAVNNTHDDMLESVFSGEPTSGSAPLSVQFTDESTGNVSYWEWDFEDDGTVDSTEQNPSHTYLEAGSYTVSLIVSDVVWDTETKVDYITVWELLQAEFSASPREGDAPLTVVFTDESTGDISYWEWDFENDGTVDSTEQNPSHTYTEPGVYTVSLTVGDGSSNTETKLEYITVWEPPQAEFSASPRQGYAPLTVDFTDESTGDNSYWEWDFENDGTVDSTEQNPSHTYTEPGVYTVSLTVGDGSSSTETKLEYITVWESLQAEFNASPKEGDAPLTVVFTDESTGNISHWEWDFENDGTVDSTEQNPSHTYTEPGVYTISLTVGDGSSSTETKLEYITVWEPPQAEFSASPRQGYAPLTVDFTDESTGNISYWEWDFDGDDIVDSTEQNPSHTYMAPGVYTVSLTVGNGTSDVETKTYYIYVIIENPPLPEEEPEE